MASPAVPTFRAQLALCVGGVALAVLLLLGALGGRQLLRATAAAQAEALHSAARGAADLIGADLREREAEIYLLSQTALLREGPLDAPAVTALLQVHKRTRAEHAWIGVADATGQVRSATDGLLVGRSVRERPWFRAATERRFVGDVHQAKLLAALLPKPDDGETTRFVDFAAPLLDAQGRVRGVIGSHVDWRWVMGTLERVRTNHGLGPAVELLVLDQHGDVLYPQALLAQRVVLPEVKDRRAALARWGTDGEYLGSVVEVRAGGPSELGWRIAVRQPKESALAPLQAQLLRLLVLGLLATVLVASVAFVLAERLSAPLRGLVEVARRVAGGDRSTRFPTDGSTRELRTLACALRAMTDNLLAKESDLAAANAGLEAAVLDRTQELQRANAELERLATHDALTGVYNRRWFDARLLECLANAQRSGRPFALLLVDADHFKQVNDQHGHAVGDAVLRLLAGVLQAHTRSTDFVARIGGEEFAVLMPSTDQLADAQLVGAKLRAAVSLAEFPSVGRITVSGGLSLSAAGELGPAGAEALLARADSALYRAKAAGRDRVETQP